MAKTTEHSNTERPRPPVVVIMGHIDHGKSTLLDYIRKTNIVEKEAGGITQHIGAYEVLHTDAEGKERRITFLDTPGHEAFAKIRSRGATIASIAILVVSAEEGVKPQTLEALSFIKKAGIPYIVAMTKIDKPNADVERTKQNLAENEIYIEGYGGTTPGVPVSGKTGDGIPELFDMICLIADLEPKMANEDALAEGVVIESNMDKKKGISATLIITSGTLKKGMPIVAGEAFSPVRILEDWNNKQIAEATFSSPVKVVGWDEQPPVGSSFKAFENKKEAEASVKALKEGKGARENIIQETSTEERVIIPLVIKADAWGTVEAIEHELKKVEAERVGIRVLHKGVGDIVEGDVKYGSGSADTLIVGFNVKTDARAATLIERLGLKSEQFSIIYKLTEWLQEIAKERTPKISVDELTGEVKIIKIFSKNKDRQIIGGKVQEGQLILGSTVKIFRRENEIGTGTVKELQQQKVKAKSVEAGNEFGAMIESKIEMIPGDRLKPFTVVVK